MMSVLARYQALLQTIFDTFRRNTFRMPLSGWLSFLREVNLMLPEVTVR